MDAGVLVLTLAGLTACSGGKDDGDDTGTAPPVELGGYAVTAWSPATACLDDEYAASTGPDGFSLSAADYFGTEYVNFEATYADGWSSMWPLSFESSDALPLAAVLLTAGSTAEEGVCDFMRVEATLDEASGVVTITGQVYEGTGPADEDGVCWTDQAHTLEDDARCGEFSLSGEYSGG